MKTSNSSLRLEEIRKKYDTPTKSDYKENYRRSSYAPKESSSHQNIDHN